MRESFVARVEQFLLHGLQPRPIDVGEVFPTHAPPFALYLHVPFCSSLCGYCSFNKRRSAGDMDRYIDALLHEADMWASHPRFRGSEVTSVFVGGGTPSFLPGATFARMLRAVQDRFGVKDVQVTSEANPESIDKEKLAVMRASGVNRLSIGVQTFDETQLRRIGRRHRGIDAERAVARARDVFDEVSIDLMYGQPDQTQQGFQRDIERAIGLPITHLSFFPFVYRPDTPIGRRMQAQGGQERLWRMYEWAAERLESEGFTAYTSEDFTRSGTPCRYQVDMWEPPVKATLGLGAGALSGFGEWSWHDIGPIDAYVDAALANRFPIAGGARMTRRERMIEHVLLGLHTLAVHPSRFEREIGIPLWRAFGPAPQVLAALGFVRRRDDGAWTPTRRGAFAVSHAWTGFVLDQLAKAAADRGSSVRHLKLLADLESGRDLVA